MFQEAHHNLPPHLLQAFNGILNIVQQRLSESHVGIRNIESIINALITSTNAETSLPFLLRFAEQSFAINDQELRHALSLVVSREEEGIHEAVFYVRSVRLTGDEAVRVLEEYHTQYYDPDFFPEASGYIQGLDNVYFRYVGYTSESTPLHRLQQDLRSTMSRFSNFSSTLQDIYPHKRYTVFEIPQLTIFGWDGQTQQRAVADDAEMTLIHILGRHAILNSQPGGRYFTFVPTDQEIAAVESLHMEHVRSYILLLLTNQHQEVPQEIQMIRDAVEDIYHRYHAQLRTVDHTVSSVITEGHLSFYANQSLPLPGSVISGRVPFAILADIISQGSFHQLRHFHDASRSGALISDFMKLVAFGDQSPNGSSDRNVAIPFLDVWPTRVVGHDDLHIETASKTLRVLSPLVIATLGLHPASVAYSNCHGRYSLEKTQYPEVVGEPFITNYDSAFSYENAPEGSEPELYWADAVPHVHPGTANYGSVDPRSLRFMYLCWVRTLLLTDTCLEMLQSQETTVIPGTKAFAQQLLYRYQSREQGANISHALDSARQGLTELWDTAAERRRRARDRLGDEYIGSWTERERSEHNRAILKERTERIGYVRGARNSQERRQQALMLHRYNYASLRCWPGYMDVNTWTQWFSNQRTGASVLYLTMRQAETHNTEPVGGLSREDIHSVQQIGISPPGAQDNLWIEDPQERQAALDRRGVLMRRGLPADFFSSENQQRRSRMRATAIPYMEVMEGREVRIQRNGRFVLNWSDGNRELGFRLWINTSRYSRAYIDSQTWRVRFVPEGICIIGSDGTILDIVSLDRIRDQPQGEDLERMWHTERERITDERAAGRTHRTHEGVIGVGPFQPVPTEPRTRLQTRIAQQAHGEVPSTTPEPRIHVQTTAAQQQAHFAIPSTLPQPRPRLQTTEAQQAQGVVSSVPPQPRPRLQTRVAQQAQGVVSSTPPQPRPRLQTTAAQQQAHSAIPSTLPQPRPRLQTRAVQLLSRNRSYVPE